jgi:hypothetical protein
MSLFKKKEEKDEEKPEYVCEICGFKTESKKGLAGHMRLAHEKPVKADSFKEYVDESVKKALESMRESMIKLIDERIDAKMSITVETLREICSRLDKIIQMKAETPVAKVNVSKVLRHIAECDECKAELYKIIDEKSKDDLEKLSSKVNDLEKKVKEHYHYGDKVEFEKRKSWL